MKKCFINKKMFVLFGSIFLISCANNSMDLEESAEHEIASSDKSNQEVTDKKTSQKQASYSGKVISIHGAAQAIVWYHPRIAQAKSNENSEKEMIDIAKAAYYPQIRSGIGMKRESERSARYDREYLQDMNVELNQVLYDFGKISSSVKSAEFGYLGAKNQTVMTNEELIHIAASTVLTTNRFYEINKLTTEQVASVSSLTKLVEKRNEEGASNLSDVYQAKSRLDNVLSEDLDTVSQYQSVLRTLGLMIGQKNITGAVVKDLPSSLAFACNTKSKWDEIPSYKAAELEAERAVAELERAKAEELPTISLRGSASKTLNATPKYGSRYNPTVSVNVTVPVYQGGALSSNKKVAESMIHSANARKAEIKLEIDQLMSESEVALENFKARESLLVQRSFNLKNTKELYKKQYLELGTRTLVDLLNSEQEYHQAKVDAVNNKFDMVQTQINCAYYQGKLGEYLQVTSD